MVNLVKCRSEIEFVRSEGHGAEKPVLRLPGKDLTPHDAQDHLITVI